MRLGTADVLVRAKTDKFDKDIDKSKKKVKSFGISGKKSLSGLTSSFASLAGAAGVGALTVSLTGLVVIGAKFESQMATVRGIMRASEKDFQLLSDAAKKMGATTEWSATQSAEALEFMALAGWSVGKSIEGLPGMLDAATAAGANLGETSDILTDTLTAMGLEIEDMDRLTDVMIGTTTRANTSFLQMGEALKESAPYAKAYGFEIEEVAALLGVVADAGIKGSDAGTGLKNTWINNAKAAKLLGTEATDLIGTLRAANKAQWDTNQFAKIYGKIAGKTVLNIAAQIDKYEALAETLHDVSGETKELADIKLDTLIGDWKIFKSAVESTGISVFEGIKEQLRIVVQLTTELATYTNIWVKTWQAIGLASSGTIDFKVALTDADAALKTFTEDMGPEKLRLAFLDRIIATGKFTWQVDREAKKLRELIANRKSFLSELEAMEARAKAMEKMAKKPDELKKIEADANKKYFKAELKAMEERAKRLDELKKIESDVNKEYFDAEKKAMEERAKRLDELQEIEQSVIAETAQAYMDLYNNFGILSQEAYDQLYNQYVKDRDDFIALTGDKEAAQEVFAQRLNALNKEMETSEKSWTDGAKAGLDDYAKTAMDVVGNVQNAFVSGFKGMEDALVDFCMTGKLDFASLANSIIRDMLRIYIQSQITGVLAGAVGGYLGGTTPPPTTPPITPVAAPSLTYVAQGGVFNSPNLSAHSNSVVDSPTLFSFAQGRGLMGEAGPEAIMPLTRLPGGDLGVKAKSGNGESKRPMEIHIHEAPGTQTRTEESEDGTRLDVIIEQVEQAMTGRMGRGTGLAPFMDSRYARTY